MALTGFLERSSTIIRPGVLYYKGGKSGNICHIMTSAAGRASGERTSRHHLKLDDPLFYQIVRKNVWRSVRSKVLQKLLLVWANATVSPEIASELGRKGLRPTKRNIMKLVDTAFVQSVVGGKKQEHRVSERTAREYVDALRFIVEAKVPWISIDESLVPGKGSIRGVSETEILRRYKGLRKALGL